MKSHSDLTRSLSYFCQDRSSLKTKIALLTFFQVNYSDYTEKILVLFEYLQLISQTLLLSPRIYNTSDTETLFITKVVVYFFKLVNPSYLLTFKESDKVMYIILLMVFGFTILKCLVFAYIACIALWNRKPNNLLIRLWRFIFRFQGRFLCFFVTSFWIRAILDSSMGDFTIQGINNLTIISISAILIVMEYLLSFFIEVQFCYILPTKNFLSSKNFHTQVITLIQKLIIQVIQVIFSSNSITDMWTPSVINLLLSLLRASQYYRILPLYNIKALIYQGNLISLVLSIHLVFFMLALLSKVNYQGADMNFAILVWIIISVIAMRFFYQMLSRTLTTLLTRYTRGPPELLVHKIWATKQLSECQKVPNPKTGKARWTYLLSATENVNIRAVFNLSPNFLFGQQLDINEATDIAKVYLEYIGKLSVQFPRSGFVKLHLAQLIVKNSDLYARAIRILAELKKSTWSVEYLSCSLLLYQAQNAILNDSESDSGLDLPTFIRSKVYVDELRKEMLKEIELKIGICKNILQNTCDIGEIFNSAQLVHKSKARIYRTRGLLPHVLPSYYLEPLLLCAEYYQVLDFNLRDYKKDNNEYVNKYIKYEKCFKDANLQEKNIYQGNNAFLMLSGQKRSSGSIVFCTKSMQNICGGEQMVNHKRHISSIFTPSLQVYYSNCFKEIFETGKRSIMNEVMRTYLAHKDGYMVEADFYLRVHPYITQDLYLNMIIRPVPIKNECLLLRENGDVEGATKKIAEILGIFTSSQVSLPAINIKQLSEELATANEALNIINRSPDSIQIGDKEDHMPEKIPLSHQGSNHLQPKSGSRRSEGFSPLLDHRTAFNLYTLYTTKGKRIIFQPAKQSLRKSNSSSSQKDYSYHCTVSLLQFGSIYMKLITLVPEALMKSQTYGETTTKQTSQRTEASIAKVEKPQTSKSKSMGMNLLVEPENIEECNELDANFKVITCWRPNPKIRVEEILPSPKESSSHRQLLPTITFIQSDRKTFRSQSLTQRQSFLGSIMSHRKLEESQDDQPRKRERMQQESSISTSFQALKEKSIFKAYRMALITKSYPKSFNFFCFMFYAVILAALISQVVLKDISSSTMTDLVVKKDMLNYAQLRAFYVARITINCRGGFLAIDGEIDPTRFHDAGLTSKVTLASLKVYYTNLVEANKGIINGIDSLDSSITQKLFEKNIRIYGTYANSLDSSYEDVTSFQAIDHYANALRALFLLDDYYSQQAHDARNFIFRNTLNDFFVKDNEITSIFKNSVSLGKNYFESAVRLCFIVTPISLTSILILLVLIIWRQYNKENAHMLAFVKLHPASIQDVLKSLTAFKKSLVEEELFESKSAAICFDDPAFLSQELQPPNYHKKQNIQTIKYHKIHVRYYGYILKAIFYIVILIMFVIWNFVSAQQSTKIIYRRQSELQFANYIGMRVAIPYMAFMELYVTNNTNFVEGRTPMDTLLLGLRDIRTIREKLAETFSEGDKSYDPQVKAILFDNDICSKLNGISSIYCRFFESAKQPTSLVPMLALYESMMTAKVSLYQNSDKSSIPNLIAQALVDSSNLLHGYGLIVAESQLLAQVINSNLAASISEASNQRRIILILFAICLSVVSMLIWSQVLSRLREVNNNFKKVLQVLPLNLILSSFLLKTFLKKKFSDS